MHCFTAVKTEVKKTKKKGTKSTHPLQILSQVHEHAHARVDAVLLRLQHQILLLLLRGQQRLVEAGLPLQLPVLVDEVQRALGEPQLLRQLAQLDQRVEPLLQLLQPLRALAHLGRLAGRLGAARAEARLAGLAVLQAERLELDFVALVQDGLHLQAVLEGAGHVEGDGAVLHRALRAETKTLAGRSASVTAFKADVTLSGD